jgi:hypothetical protein
MYDEVLSELSMDNAKEQIREASRRLARPKRFCVMVEHHFI